MDIKSKKYIKLFIGIGFLCSCISGLYLSRLIVIPFCFTFYMVLYLFVTALSILLLSISILCFRASRIWLKMTGIIPVLLSIIIIGFTIIISTDYRILYYRSFAPEPSKTESITSLISLVKSFTT